MQTKVSLVVPILPHRSRTPAQTVLWLELGNMISGGARPIWYYFEPLGQILYYCLVF